MKKYFYLKIELCSYDKVVKVIKDMAYFCTEARMHEIAFEICKKLESAGLTFNGRNVNHYFECSFCEAPSPKELDKIINNFPSA